MIINNVFDDNYNLVMINFNLFPTICYDYLYNNEAEYINENICVIYTFVPEFIIKGKSARHGLVQAAIPTNSQTFTAKLQMSYQEEDVMNNTMYKLPISVIIQKTNLSQDEVIEILKNNTKNNVIYETIEKYINKNIWFE